MLPVSESDVADPTWLLGEKDADVSEEEEEGDLIEDPWSDIEGADEGLCFAA